jgi:hypothetical protein
MRLSVVTCVTFMLWSCSEGRGAEARAVSIGALLDGDLDAENGVVVKAFIYFDHPSCAFDSHGDMIRFIENRHESNRCLEVHFPQVGRKTINVEGRQIREGTWTNSQVLLSGKLVITDTASDGRTVALIRPHILPGPDGNIAVP